MLDHIIRKPLVKLLAFLLSVVLVVATGLTMLAFSFCSAESFYLTGNSGIYHSTMISGVLQSTAYNMLRLYVNQGDVSEGEASVLRRYPPTDTNLRFQIIPEEEDGDIVTNTSEDETDLQYNTWYGWYVLDKYGGLYYLSLESQPGLGESYYSDGYLEADDVVKLDDNELGLRQTSRAPDLQDFYQILHVLEQKESALEIKNKINTLLHENIC